MTALHAHHRNNPEMSHRKSSPWRLVDGVLIRIDSVDGATVRSAIRAEPLLGDPSRSKFLYAVSDGESVYEGFADSVMYAKNRVLVVLRRWGKK